MMQIVGMDQGLPAMAENIGRGAAGEPLPAAVDIVQAAVGTCYPEVCR